MSERRTGYLEWRDEVKLMKTNKDSQGKRRKSRELGSRKPKEGSTYSHSLGSLMINL